MGERKKTFSEIINTKRMSHPSYDKFGEIENY